jgi:exonuclease SbcC
MKAAEGAIKLLENELVALRQLEQNEYQAHNRRSAGLEERLKQIEAGLETWQQGGALRLAEISRILETEAFAAESRQELARIEQKMHESGYEPDRHSVLRQAELEGRTSAELLQTISRQVATLAEKLKNARASLEDWAARPAVRLAALEDILVLENFALSARQDLEKVDQVLRSLGYDPAAHAAVRRAELEGRQTEEKLRQMDALRAAVTGLEREMEGLRPQCQAGEEEVSIQELAFRQAEQKYRQTAASLPDLDQVEQEVFELKEQEGRLKMQVGGARQQVEVLKNLKARRKELEQRRVTLTLQIARFKQLEKAFSKDGVPALLIEQALPDLETQANEILDRLSGGEMSVRFATQKDFRDRNRDDKKETLDILISDAAGTREYEMFSGGEAFRVNFAIRLALSRLLAQRAGARLQTLVIDEGFGSQDAEGRQRLVEAINLVRPDFSKVLVITHLEELKDAFPARIEVEKTSTGSRLRVM